MIDESDLAEVWVRLSRSHDSSFTTAAFVLAALLISIAVIKVYEQLQCYESAHKALAAQNISRAPSGNPFAADAPWKREDLHRVGQNDCEKLGGIFYFRILWFNCVQISDPWLLHEVLAVAGRRPDLIDKPRGFPLPVYDCFDRGTSYPPQPCLISAKSADPWHKVVRRGVSPAFSPENIRNSFDAILEIAERLGDRLLEHGPDQGIDIDGALQCESFDVIGRIGFNHDFRATEDLSGPGAANCRTIKEGCAIGVNDMRNPVRPLLRSVPFLPEAWTHRRKVARVQRQLLGMLHSLAREVCSRGARDLAQDASIGNHLMHLHRQARAPLPFTRMWSELSIFFMAGMETTAHAITWALYLISQHPEVESRILEELDGAGLLMSAQRPSPRKLARDDVACPQQLPYLKAALKEAQRMYSVAPLVVRKALQDVRIRQYTIPRGTAMILHLFAMHNTSANFERHAEFLPERWLEADAETARPIPGTSSTGKAADQKVKRFLPFLSGSRSCIGMSLAQLNYTTAVASLLSRFSFRLAEDMGGPTGVRAKEVYFVTIQPKEKLNMHVQSRGPAPQQEELHEASKGEPLTPQLWGRSLSL